MFRVLLACPLACLVTSVAVGQPKAQNTDHEKIQGNWVATEITVAGEKCPEKQVAGTRMRFKNDKIEYTSPAPDDSTVVGPASLFSFKLDPTKTPKAIDMVPLDGAWKNLKMPGIYHLEGNNLTVCISDGPSDGRPKEFAALKGSTVILMKLKRVEK